MSERQYSQPKLHIPREKGKPTLAPKRPWYVWFTWRNPETGKMDLKFKYKKEINRLKSVKERKAYGKALVEAYEEALKRGWDPILKKVPTGRTSRKESTTVEKALKYAYEVKAKTRKASTLNGYEFHMNRFLEWALKFGFLGADVAKLNIDHFYEFLDWLRFDYVNAKTGESISGSSVNNHKASLSSLFTTLKNERLIPVNFIKDIPDFDSEPVNNKAFTMEDIARIKKALAEEDPYLIPFIGFILYPLLRPSEICRLRVEDINLEKSMLSVETKTDVLSHRRIIKKLEPTIQAMQLTKKGGKLHLFTSQNEPAVWDVPLKSKVDHFGLRFRKIKNKLGYGREYGLYSFRHSAIMDLYNSLVSQGMGEMEILFKLMPITQHKSIAGIKNYLRQHKRSIPADHSDIYTIDWNPAG